MGYVPFGVILRATDTEITRLMGEMPRMPGNEKRSLLSVALDDGKSNDRTEVYSKLTEKMKRDCQLLIQTIYNRDKLLRVLADTLTDDGSIKSYPSILPLIPALALDCGESFLERMTDVVGLVFQCCQKSIRAQEIDSFVACTAALASLVKATRGFYLSTPDGIDGQVKCFVEAFRSIEEKDRTIISLIGSCVGWCLRSVYKIEEWIGSLEKIEDCSIVPYSILSLCWGGSKVSLSKLTEGFIKSIVERMGVDEEKYNYWSNVLQLMIDNLVTQGVFALKLLKCLCSKSFSLLKSGRCDTMGVGGFPVGNTKMLDTILWFVFQILKNKGKKDRKGEKLRNKLKTKKLQNEVKAKQEAIHEMKKSTHIFLTKVQERINDPKVCSTKPQATTLSLLASIEIVHESGQGRQTHNELHFLSLVSGDEVFHVLLRCYRSANNMSDFLKMFSVELVDTLVKKDANEELSGESCFLLMTIAGDLLKLEEDRNKKLHLQSQMTQLKVFQRRHRLDITSRPGVDKESYEMGLSKSLLFSQFVTSARVSIDSIPVEPYFRKESLFNTPNKERELLAKLNNITSMERLVLFSLLKQALTTTDDKVVYSIPYDVLQYKEVYPFIHSLVDFFCIPNRKTTFEKLYGILEYNIREGNRCIYSYAHLYQEMLLCCPAEEEDLAQILRLFLCYVAYDVTAVAGENLLTLVQLARDNKKYDKYPLLMVPFALSNISFAWNVLDLRKAENEARELMESEDDSCDSGSSFVEAVHSFISSVYLADDTKPKTGGKLSNNTDVKAGKSATSNGDIPNDVLYTYVLESMATTPRDGESEHSDSSNYCGWTCASTLSDLISPLYFTTLCCPGFHFKRNMTTSISGAAQSAPSLHNSDPFLQISCRSRDVELAPMSVCHLSIRNFVSFLIQNLYSLSDIFLVDLKSIYSILIDVIDKEVFRQVEERQMDGDRDEDDGMNRGTNRDTIKRFKIKGSSISKLFFLLLLLDSHKEKILSKLLLSNDEINSLCVKLTKLLYSDINNSMISSTSKQFSICQAGDKNKTFISGDLKVLIIGFICSINANLRRYASTLIDIYRCPSEVHRIIFDNDKISFGAVADQRHQATDDRGRSPNQRQYYDYIPVEQLEFVNNVLDKIAYQDLDLVSVLIHKNIVKSSGKNGVQRNTESTNSIKRASKRGRGKKRLANEEEKENKEEMESGNAEMAAKVSNMLGSGSSGSTPLTDISAIRVTSVDYPFVMALLTPVIYCHLMNEKTDDSSFKELLSYIGGQQDFQLSDKEESKETTMMSGANKSAIIILCDIYKQITGKLQDVLLRCKTEKISGGFSDKDESRQKYPLGVLRGFISGTQRLFDIIPSIFINLKRAEEAGVVDLPRVLNIHDPLEQTLSLLISVLTDIHITERNAGGQCSYIKYSSVFSRDKEISRYKGSVLSLIKDIFSSYVALEGYGSGTEETNSTKLKFFVANEVKDQLQCYIKEQMGKKNCGEERLFSHYVIQLLHSLSSHFKNMSQEEAAEEEELRDEGESFIHFLDSLLTNNACEWSGFGSENKTPCAGLFLGSLVSDCNLEFGEVKKRMKGLNIKRGKVAKGVMIREEEDLKKSLEFVFMTLELLYRYPFNRLVNNATLTVIHPNYISLISSVLTFIVKEMDKKFIPSSYSSLLFRIKKVTIDCFKHITTLTNTSFIEKHRAKPNNDHDTNIENQCSHLIQLFCRLVAMKYSIQPEERDELIKMVRQLSVCSKFEQFNRSLCGSSKGNNTITISTVSDCLNILSQLFSSGNLSRMTRAELMLLIVNLLNGIDFSGMANEAMKQEFSTSPNGRRIDLFSILANLVLVSFNDRPILYSRDSSTLLDNNNNNDNNWRGLTLKESSGLQNGNKGRESSEALTQDLIILLINLMTFGSTMAPNDPQLVIFDVYNSSSLFHNVVVVFFEVLSSMIGHRTFELRTLFDVVVENILLPYNSLGSNQRSTNCLKDNSTTTMFPTVSEHHGDVSNRSTGVLLYNPVVLYNRYQEEQDVELIVAKTMELESKIKNKARPPQFDKVIISNINKRLRRESKVLGEKFEPHKKAVKYQRAGGRTLDMKNRGDAPLVIEGEEEKQSSDIKGALVAADDKIREYYKVVSAISQTDSHKYNNIINNKYDYDKQYETNQYQNKELADVMESLKPLLAEHKEIIPVVESHNGDAETPNTTANLVFYVLVGMLELTSASCRKCGEDDLENSLFSAPDVYESFQLLVQKIQNTQQALYDIIDCLGHHIQEGSFTSTFNVKIVPDSLVESFLVPLSILTMNIRVFKTRVLGNRVQADGSEDDDFTIDANGGVSNEETSLLRVLLPMLTATSLNKVVLNSSSVIAGDGAGSGYGNRGNDNAAASSGFKTAIDLSLLPAVVESVNIWKRRVDTDLLVNKVIQLDNDTTVLKGITFAPDNLMLSSPMLLNLPFIYNLPTSSDKCGGATDEVMKVSSSDQGEQKSLFQTAVALMRFKKLTLVSLKRTMGILTSKLNDYTSEVGVALLNGAKMNKIKGTRSKDRVLCAASKLALTALTTLLSTEVFGVNGTNNTEPPLNADKARLEAQNKEEKQLGYIKDLSSLFIPLLSNPLSSIRELARKSLGKIVICGVGMMAGIDIENKRREGIASFACPLHKAMDSLLMSTYVSTLESCSSNTSKAVQLKSSSSSETMEQTSLSSIGNKTFTAQTKFLMYKGRQKNVTYTVWSVLKAVREGLESQFRQLDENENLELNGDGQGSIILNKLGLLNHCTCGGRCIATILYKSSKILDREVREDKEAKKLLELKSRGIKVKSKPNEREPKDLFKENMKKSIISPSYKDCGIATANGSSLSRCVMFLLLRDTIGSLSSKYLYKSKKSGSDKLSGNDEADVVHSGLKLAKFLGAETEWGFEEVVPRIVAIRPLPPPLVSAVLNIPIFTGSGGKVKRRAKGADASAAALRGEITESVENNGLLLRDTYDFANIDIGNIRSLQSCVDFVLRMAVTLFYNEADSRSLTFSDDAVTRINSNIVSHGNGTGSSNTGVGITSGSFAKNQTFSTGGMMGAVLIEIAKGIVNNRNITDKKLCGFADAGQKHISSGVSAIVTDMTELLTNCSNISLRYRLMEKKLKDQHDSEIFDMIALGDSSTRKRKTNKGENVAVEMDSLCSMNRSNINVIKHSLSHVTREELLKVGKAPDLERNRSFGDEKLKNNLPIFSLVRCTIPLCTLFAVTTCSQLCGKLCDEVEGLNRDVVQIIDSCRTETTGIDECADKTVIKLESVLENIKGTEQVISLFDLIVSGSGGTNDCYQNEETADSNGGIAGKLNVDFKKGSCLMARDMFIVAEAFNFISNIKLTIVESSDSISMEDKLDVDGVQASSTDNSKTNNLRRAVSIMQGTLKNIPLFFCSLKNLLATHLMFNNKSANEVALKAIQSCDHILHMCRRMTYTIAAAIALYIPGNASILSSTNLLSQQGGKIGNEVTRNGIIRGNVGGAALSLLCNKNVFSWEGDREWSPSTMLVPSNASSLVVKTVSVAIIDSLCSCVRGLTNDMRVYTALLERVTAVRRKQTEFDESSREVELIQEAVLMLPTILASVADATALDTKNTEATGNELCSIITRICVEWAMWDKGATRWEDYMSEKNVKKSNRSLMVDSAMKMLTKAVGGKLPMKVERERYEMTSFFNPNACMSAITLLDSLLSISLYIDNRRGEVILGTANDSAEIKKASTRTQLWSQGVFDDASVSLLVLLCIAVYQNSGNVENMECEVKATQNREEMISTDGAKVPKRKRKTKVVVNKLRLACCQLLASLHLSGATQGNHTVDMNGGKGLETEDKKKYFKLSVAGPIISTLFSFIDKANSSISAFLSTNFVSNFQKGSKSKVQDLRQNAGKRRAQGNVVEQATAAVGILDGFLMILLDNTDNKAVVTATKSFMESSSFHNAIESALTNAVIAHCVLNREFEVGGQSKIQLPTQQEEKPVITTDDWEYLFRLLNISAHCCGFGSSKNNEIESAISFNKESNMTRVLVSIYDDRLALKGIRDSQAIKFNSTSMLMRHERGWLRTVSLDIIHGIYRGSIGCRKSTTSPFSMFSHLSTIHHLVYLYLSIGAALLDNTITKELHKWILDIIWEDVTAYNSLVELVQPKSKKSKKIVKPIVPSWVNSVDSLESLWLHDLEGWMPGEEFLPFTVKRLINATKVLISQIRDHDDESLIPLERNVFFSLQCCVELSLHYLTMPEIEMEMDVDVGDTNTSRWKCNSKKRLAPLCSYLVQLVSNLYEEMKSAKKLAATNVRSVSEAARRALAAIQKVHPEAVMFVQRNLKKFNAME